jgi:hypothetical protein
MTRSSIRGLLGVTALAPEQVMMNNQRAQATTAQVGAQHTPLHVENQAASDKLPHTRCVRIV